MKSKWVPTIIAAVLSLTVWAITTMQGYAIATSWIPAVAIAASWPRERKEQRLAACLARLRRSNS